MKDLEFKELESKYLKEKERRDRISELKREISKLDIVIRDLKYDGTFEFSSNITITYTTYYDNGDGRSGSTEDKMYQVPQESKKDFIKFLEAYAEAKAKKVNELMNED